jgi:preprotein translocase subunit YajC
MLAFVAIFPPARPAKPTMQSRLQEIPMFSTPAYAQATGTPGFGDMLGMIPALVMIMVVFYFLLIRPQQKRAKEHQEMIGKVVRGDTIVTSGGLIGKVSRVVDERELLVEIADNVKVRVARSGIADVRAKGEPVKDEPAKQ